MTLSIHSLRTVTHSNSNERIECPEPEVMFGDDYVMQHTKALLLMDKYEIQDFYSLTFISILAILSCMFMILIMIEHSSISPSSPIYITPGERWKQILPWNYTNIDPNKVPYMPDFDYWLIE